MWFFLSPSPFPYGDSPYGYGDCVFGHPFSHVLKNIFFPHAHRANIPHYHTVIAIAVALMPLSFILSTLPSPLNAQPRPIEASSPLVRWRLPSCLPLVPLSSRLPLICQLVVASPLLSRRRRLRIATLPWPLLRHLVVATCNAPLVAPPLPLVL